MVLRCVQLAAALLAMAALGGCSSLPKPMEWVDKALEATGLKAPEPPKAALGELDASQFDTSRIARYVNLKLHASTALNIDARGRSLSLVARIYKLKTPDAFWKAPYAAFGDAAKEKELLGEDIVEVRDVQLVPGQQLNLREKLVREAGYIGVVALFHSPAPQRWRYVFAAGQLEPAGIAMGAHACALSVLAGEPMFVDPALVKLGPGLCG